MARRPRSSLPSFGVWHVTARGVARAPIVVDDIDRAAFVRQLEETAARFGWIVHAWCLMDNHFHLVVEATLEALSRGLHRLTFLHAQRFNARHDRTGHVFQGRFDARVVERDEYFGDVCRYVENNPVRAGICETAEEWPWSSAGARAARQPPVTTGSPRWTGASAGAQDASGETAPSRPFSCR